MGTYHLDERLLKLINRAIHEERVEIDDTIPDDIFNTFESQCWAYEQGLKEDNENIRYVAAGVLERSQWPESKKTDILRSLIDAFGKEDATYPKFRIARVLSKYGNRSPAIREALENGPEEFQHNALEYLTKQP